jgi:hypothetical protein
MFSSSARELQGLLATRWGDLVAVSRFSGCMHDIHDGLSVMQELLGIRWGHLLGEDFQLDFRHGCTFVSKLALR